MGEVAQKLLLCGSELSKLLGGFGLHWTSHFQEVAHVSAGRRRSPELLKSGVSCDFWLAKLESTEQLRLFGLLFGFSALNSGLASAGLPLEDCR
jgi:hypothetical protein